MTISSCETEHSGEGEYGTPLDENELATKESSPMHDDRCGSTYLSQMFYEEQIESKSKIKNDFNIFKTSLQQKVLNETTPSVNNFGTPIQQKKPVISQIAEIAEKDQNFTSVKAITEIERIKQITSDMSEEKIHQLILKSVQEGTYKQKIVPIDIWDFGGQKDYYMTHQLFITSRGIFVLMFNGNVDLHKHMPDLNFLPGHFGKPTVAGKITCFKFIFHCIFDYF